MKKIFTFIVVAMMALGATAQTLKIQFEEAAAAGTLDGKKFDHNSMELKITDTDGKMSIDENTAYFGTSGNEKVMFDYRLKTGGKSSSKNRLELIVPQDGKLRIYARTGKTSVTDRNIVVTNGEGEEVINHILLETECTQEEYETEEGETKIRTIYTPITAEVGYGPYLIEYPAGSINIYGISLNEELVPTGITNVNVTEAKNGKFIQNNRVVIVKNGKAYTPSGTSVK